MVEKVVEQEVVHKKKKNKKDKIKDDELSESCQKRKTEEDSEDSVAKKKKKKEKEKDLEVETEIKVKKKKPYFRDKGDKGEKKDEKVADENTKSKFSISLSVGDTNTIPDLPLLKSSGKGPKIIIAQEKKKIDEVKKTEVKLSKRKRKHLKTEGAVVDDSVHESKGMSKALRYLKTWAEDRQAWKFEKCRQIWLLHNAYDDTKVSESTFPSLMSYMESIKGGMRQGAIDLARQRVEKGTKWEEQSEEKSEEELQKELGDKMSDVELNRAKKILEALS
eukprot:GFUD01002816.1.p1 GENE.GFUD01002816.1~~GFUD01002816.1.p1  ORF type:complete len:277 (-),score=122.41 GFUD01002816.1:16-846(-)